MAHQEEAHLEELHQHLSVLTPNLSEGVKPFLVAAMEVEGLQEVVHYSSATKEVVVIDWFQPEQAAVVIG